MEAGIEQQGQEPQMPAQPPQEPVQAQEPQPAAQEPTQDDRFIQVEKQQFADFQGGYHEAVKYGKSYQQLERDGRLAALEHTDRMLDAYRAQSGNPNATAQEMADALLAVEAPVPLPDDPAQQPLTTAGLEKFMAEREAKQREQYEQENLKQGREREAQTVNQKLDELGFKADNPFHAQIKSILNDQIAKEIEKGFLPIQTPEQQNALMNAPASPEVIAAAAEATKAFLTDFANQSAGAIANQQTTIPGGTLGSQTPGRQGAEKLSDLTTRAQNGDKAAQEKLEAWSDGKIGDEAVIRD